VESFEPEHATLGYPRHSRRTLGESKIAGLSSEGVSELMSLSNIDIAQQARMQPIVRVARERLGIPEESLEPYGRFKAKVLARLYPPIG